MAASDREIENSTRLKIHKVVAGLGDKWSHVEPHDLDLERISGGMLNEIYRCRIKGSSGSNDLLVRFYGEAGQLAKNMSAISYSQEVIVANAAGQCGLGPKVLNIFPGGRIEQYIESTTLQSSNVACEKLNDKVARKLAQFHSLEVPLPRRDKLVDTIEILANEVLCNLEKDSCLKDKISMDFAKEWQWLKTRLMKCKSPLVLCHGDVNQKNILVRKNGDDHDIVLVDYELSTYSYRSFDIGYYFCMRTVDASTVDWVSENPPHSEKEKRHFIQTYLDEWQQIGGKLEENDNVDFILTESVFFSVMTCFSFCLWFVSKGTEFDSFSGSDANKCYQHFDRRYHEEKKEFLSLANGKSIFTDNMTQ